MASGQAGLLSWTIERVGRRTEVTIVGDLDLAVYDPLKSALHESLRMDDLVVVNLEGVSFMDSTGLRLLLELKRRIDGAGGDLLLSSVPGIVERVLEVTGTASFFDRPVRPVRPVPVISRAATA